ASIGQVLGDPELRARLTAGALREGKRYSWQRTAEQLFAIYRDVVQQRYSLPRSPGRVPANFIGWVPANFIGRWQPSS
ncbi:MAG: hypothetical protein FWG25_04065, partial [Promicromonosporaceae bacterium]|nr:hypothetical protein [Promicromonosporaceae bacterium]